MRPSASVVITTYNWPKALGRVLDSLARQTRRDFEVVVADDGSGPETGELIERLASDYPVPLRHIWQPDEGFRAAAVRNLGASVATADYLIFLDQDCMCLPGFVDSHLRYAERRWFVTGRRAQVRESVTARILDDDLQPYAIPQWLLFLQSPYWLQTRYLQLLPLPVHKTRITKHRNDTNKADSCNFAMHRDEFIACGGFDECYRGFGWEDRDLGLRLLRLGFQRKSLEHLDPVLHLYHKRSRPVSTTDEHYIDLLNSDRTQAVKSMFLR